MMRTIKIDKTRSCTVDTEKTTIYPSVEAWQAEAEKRFGKDYMNWKFQCPMCGHIASIADFKAAGAKSPNCAYTECIGRYTGKGSPKEGDSSGCNWTAYGLFGIPNGKGVFVMTGNEEGQEIFDYAPAQGEEKWAEKVCSATQLYKQAGNSIVVNVLMAIFSQMNIKGVKPWNEVHNEKK